MTTLCFRGIRSYHDFEIILRRPPCESTKLESPNFRVTEVGIQHDRIAPDIFMNDAASVDITDGPSDGNGHIDDLSPRQDPDIFK